MRDSNTLPSQLDERAAQFKYYPQPWEFREEAYNGGPGVVDAAGNCFVTLFWPIHPPEETAQAEQETYALGRAIAAIGQARAKLGEAPPSSSVPSHGAAEIGAGAKNTAELHGQGDTPPDPPVEDSASPQVTPLWRCKITGNPCGTDTEVVGFECQCDNCQRWRGDRPGPVADQSSSKTDILRVRKDGKT